MRKKKADKNVLQKLDKLSGEQIEHLIDNIRKEGVEKGKGDKIEGKNEN